MKEHARTGNRTGFIFKNNFKEDIFIEGTRRLDLNATGRGMGDPSVHSPCCNHGYSKSINQFGGKTIAHWAIYIGTQDGVITDTNRWIQSN